MTARAKGRKSFLNILPLPSLKYKATRNAFLKYYQQSVLPSPLNNTFSTKVPQLHMVIALFLRFKNKCCLHTSHHLTSFPAV